MKDPLVDCLRVIRGLRNQDWWWEQEVEPSYVPHIANLDLDGAQLTQMLALLTAEDPLRDVGADHEIADAILLVMIDDADVTKHFSALSKWYG